MSEERTPRFQGFYTHTEKNTREACYAGLPLYQKILYPLVGVLCLLTALYRLYVGYTEGPMVIVSILLIFMAVFSFQRLPQFTQSYAKRAMSRLEEMGQKGARVHIELFEDAVITGSNVSEDTHTATYDHIIRLQETRHLLMLWRPHKMFHPIEKERLEGGSVDELKAFLKEKNKNIRMR